MSDTISSASQTISSQLSSAGTSFLAKPTGDCTSSNIRFLLFVCMLILLFCLCTSFMSQVCYDSAQVSTGPHRRNLGGQSPCGCARCRMAIQENFSNDDTYAYSPASSASYQSVPLTSPNSKENAPSNLLFGQANRYISHDGDASMFTLDVFANLFVLNGNVFQKGDPPKHLYKAYLADDTKQIELGALNKDGDGIYKLKFTSTKVEDLVKLRNISIVYDRDGEKQTLLVGTLA